MTVIYSLLSFFINSRYLTRAIFLWATYSEAMLEIYIEALLVDEELADQVWESGEIDDQGAWWLLVECPVHTGSRPLVWYSLMGPLATHRSNWFR